MSKKSGLSMVWTLTVLRHGAQGEIEELEKTEFRYARTKDELEWSTEKVLPQPLVAMLRQGDLEGDAMETGFIIQMSRLQCPEEGWRLFEMLAGDVSWSMHREGGPRSVYAVGGSPGSVEFVDTNCCSFYNKLPERIWMRIIPLPISVVAWAFSNGIYECADGVQMTLDDWAEMPPRILEKDKELALPGPSDRQYSFM